jgi:RNA polymerase sigma factor (sigma-70 family)
MILHYSDEAILDGLRHNRDSCINYVYREYLPIARSIVERKSGTRQDVEDVLQEALFVLYKRSLNPEATWNCSLKTYFYSVCRNIWLQKLDRKYRLFFQSDIEVHEDRCQYLPDDPEIRESILERRRLFTLHFSTLPADCQSLLRLFFARKSFKEIALLMGLISEKYAKQKKYLCKNMLRKRIINDPKCQQFLHYGRPDEDE